MDKYTDLGKVVKRHVSNMAETDKGNRFPAGTDVDKGDQLIEVDGRKVFIKADEWAKIKADEWAKIKADEWAKIKAAAADVKKVKYRPGVTKPLREKAEALGLKVYITTTKEVLEEAIVEAESAKELTDLVAQAVEAGVENAEAMSKDELIAAIAGDGSGAA